MAIISVNPIPEDEGEESKDGYTFTKVWRVITDAHSDGEYEVLNAGGIPRHGDSHYSGKARVIGRRAAHESDLTWLANIQYGKESESETGGGGGGDPTDPNGNGTIPTMAIGTERTNRFSESDYHGILIANSSGDRFETPDEYEDADQTITISHTIPFELINEGTIAFWINVVHGPDVQHGFTQDPGDLSDKLGGQFVKFFGHGGLTTRLLDFGASMVQETEFLTGNTVTKWAINLRFVVTRCWLHTALDEGFYTLAAGGLSQGLASVNIANRKRILDASGVPTIKAAPLNGNGEPLAGKGFWWRYWQRYKHANLNALLNQLRLPTIMANYKVVKQR